MTYIDPNIPFVILNVGFASHDKDWNWNNIRSPFTRIYLVTGGRAKLKLENGIYDLTPGNLYIIPSFTLHSDICDGLFEHYYIHIYENGDSDSQILENLDFPLEVPAEAIDSMLFKRLCEVNPMMRLPHSNPESYDNAQSLNQNIIRNRLCENYSQTESEGIVLQLLSRFLRSAKPKEQASDDRIRKVLLHISRNINKQIDIEELSEIACMSKDHFIRIFKKEIGQTPLNYITRRKLDKAELLLTTTDNPIKEIAYEVGYEDNSYFNRLFKSRIGVTPQRYRESRKK